MTLLITSLLLTLTNLTHAQNKDPHPNTLRVMTYNIWHVFAKGKEVEAGCQFIKEQSPDVVALQELTSIKPERLQELASNWEHPHSSLLKTNGFSVGLTSRWPIEVVEKGFSGMHHGYLHAKTNGVHYFVVHLSPFKWEVRHREADLLCKKIAPLLRQNESVIVLGDFNALTPDDRRWLESKDNANLLESKLQTDARHAHVQNLKGGKFEYGVLQKFHELGLVDTAKNHLPEKVEARLTSPTGVWDDKKTAVKKGQRIDFILASKDLYRKVKGCKIITEGEVNKISDHYPVITDFNK
ncbi:endonuclease/exonuclease/phosphatase family protein [Rubritalea tangerina]|uniref:Endonuclease/exonuclease/phosphatase family protein n=2 Tax=Rubritalea tangerina TaxID=430798 RepID=A0ABW4ZCF1_9BACT